MKQLRILLALVVAILLIVGTPLSALAAESTVTSSDDIENIFATATDAEVVIHMENDITMDSSAVLEAKENQKYTIIGNGYTLSAVKIKGSGEVVIEADVVNGSATYALITDEEVTVTVKGNIISSDSGVAANGDSSVTITGNVTAENCAISTGNSAQVSVTGDVSAENYETVITYENSVVTITGDVYSGGFGDGAIAAWEYSSFIHLLVLLYCRSRAGVN